MRVMVDVLPAKALAECQQALRYCEEGKQICLKASNCGMDVSGPEAALHAISQKLQAVLREFGQSGVKPT